MGREKVLIILSLLLLCQGYALSQQIPDLVAEQGYADMILLNGKIVSMDDRSSVPNTPGNIREAMAIKGKRIMALGSNEEIRRLAWSKTRVVDLGGKTVIPGLIATHYHLFGPAARDFGPSQGLLDPSVRLTVVSETTAEGTARKIRDTIVNAIRVQDIPEGDWITVGLEENKTNVLGATGGWLYLGEINRRQIDAGTEKHPVLVKMGIYGMFNSAAVDAYVKEFPDWEEHVDWENRPGAARDGYAAVPEQGGITFEFWWKDEPLVKLAEALRLHGVEVRNYGVTTVSTRILYPQVQAAYQQLNREGRMPHRLSYYVESQRGNYFGRKSVEEFYRATGAPWTNHANGGEMLWVGGMTNEIWDSLRQEVCMGPDMPGASAEVKALQRCPSPGSKPWESYKAALAWGWRPVQSHGVGSHGARLYIQMLEESMQERGYSVEYIRNLRTTLEHNTLLGNVPDVIAGIKKYGIILNCQPPNLGRAEKYFNDYGEGIRPYLMPVKTWIEQGIRVTFEARGTDFWSPLYTLVTRKAENQSPDAEGEWIEVVPEEAIDRVTALKMATTWAAEYVMAEDTLGVLEPGKYADFAVLDQDYFTIPVDEILKLRVIMTGLNGQIVYDRDQLVSAR